MGVDVLLFWFEDDWGRYGRTYEKVASHLALLPTVDHVVCTFPPEIARRRQGSRLLRERRLSPKLVLLTEQITPSHAGRLSRTRASVNGWMTGRALRGYLGTLGFAPDRTILWMFPPHPYIDRIRAMVPHRCVVAHVIDDFTKFDPSHWLYHDAMRQYPTIGEWADVIFTMSEANQARFAAAGVPCHRFAQAVDESFIGAPSELPHRATRARPRLGYVGFIMARTDLALLREVAARRPDWDLVLLGPEYPSGHVKESGVLDLPNVSWPGELANAEVPAFLRSLDVCLMPHLDTAYTRSMAPLKLYQYLASGRPVVCTPVRGIEFAAGHVRVATDAAGFVAQVQECLDHDDADRSAARIELVRTETWRTRAAEMLHTATRV